MRLIKDVSDGDLEAYTKALFNQVIQLQIELEKTKEKLAHAEELLRNIEGLDI